VHCRKILVLQKGFSCSFYLVF